MGNGKDVACDTLGLGKDRKKGRKEGRERGREGGRRKEKEGRKKEGGKRKYIIVGGSWAKKRGHCSAIFTISLHSYTISKLLRSLKNFC